MPKEDRKWWPAADGAGAGLRSASEQLLDAGVVGAGQRDLVEQPPGPLARLVLEQVIPVRPATHDLAVGGDAKPLGRTTVRLGLGHVCLSITRGWVGWCGRADQAGAGAPARPT